MNSENGNRPSLGRCIVPVAVTTVLVCNGAAALGAAGDFFPTLQDLPVPSGGENPGTEAVAVGDVDGDGDLDVVVAHIDFQTGTGDPLPAPNQVWLNQGQGCFEPGDSFDPGFSGDIALGDLDGDGDLDAFVANGAATAGGCGALPEQANTVWFNDGFGNFSDSGLALGLGESSGIALGDLDGDGDLDAFVTDTDNIVIWKNPGTGLFTTQFATPAGLPMLGCSNASFWDVELGDLDGDGDLDAYLAVRGVTFHDRVLLNDGSGSFTDTGQNLSRPAFPVGFINYCNDATLVDLDGDGDLDVVTARGSSSPEPPVWFLNLGTGTFSAGVEGASGSAGSDGRIDAGDIDGDGFDDVIVGFPSPWRIGISDGAGGLTFTSPSLSGLPGVGDFDADGDPDAFGAVYPLAAASHNVYLNDEPDADTLCASGGGGGAIPTVSEWGLIVMSLVLLIGVTVVVRRNRPHAHLTA